MCLAAAEVVFLGLQKASWQTEENVTGCLCFTALCRRGLNCWFPTLQQEKKFRLTGSIERRSNTADIFN